MSFALLPLLLPLPLTFTHTPTVSTVAQVRGVSGGERKRVSIGVQLITNPSLLFLDEPTSGLDGFQAQSVMRAMKNLTLNNRMVMAVIHQPRSSIYQVSPYLSVIS
jgi:ABC-type multidrug transport system ATPase subunit